MDAVARRGVDTQFGLAWNWEYDHEFVRLLDQACLLAGLSCFLVGHHNLKPTSLAVQNDERRFLWFLDRASDNDPQFLQFNQLLQAKGTRFLNPHIHYQRAIDKANIHGDLREHGLHVPVTVILPPFEAEPRFDPRLLEPFRDPFVIKPARGGGGWGVTVGATLPDQVTQTRARYRNQRFLLQQRIVPQVLGGRRAWFRVYFVCGHVISCWWDDTTHRYAIFTPADRALVNTEELARIVRLVAEVAHLDFFSTEIALDRDQRYVLIDYVNDPCDMRLQSGHFDGVPDAIAREIATSIARHLETKFRPTVPAETTAMGS